MKKMPVHLVIAMTLLVLCGFRFSLLFGELSWQKIDAVLREDFPTVRNMEIDELRNRVAAGEQIHLVDVRSREEYQVSHIPGAVLAEEFEIADRVDNAVVVAYCSVGLRSAEYVRTLQKEGVQQIYNLRGSIFMWANKGLKLQPEEQGRRVVHPYNSRWGKLLDKDLHSQ